MLRWRRLWQAGFGFALGVASLALRADSIPPVPAMRGADEPSAEHAVDVVDYTLDAKLDTSTHVVHGEGTIRWRNLSRSPVREIWLHLYLNAFKNEQSVFLRAPIGSGRGTQAVSDWGYIDVRKLVAPDLDGADLWAGADKTTPGDPNDETDIRVPLPREIAPGESLTLEVAWDSKLPSFVERTGHLGDFYLVGQWFPKIARLEANGQWRHFPFYHLSEFYADFGTYDVTIDVPAGVVVGATGTLVSSSKADGRQIVRYQQRDVHDFAWTAWRSFREKTAEAEGVHLRCLYPPGYDAVAERELATASFALRYFGERYGRYPYPVLTLVHPPIGASEAGGMEYPTFITTGGVWYEPPFSHAIDSVTIHEFGHQYFYGLVATDEQTWPVLDEGLNSYAESDAMSARFGAGSTVDFMGFRLSLETVFRQGGQEAVHNEPIAQPAQAFASSSDYARLVYARTATLLTSLSRVYGREAFSRALGRYTRKFRFQHPTLADFIGVIREDLGDGAARNLEIGLADKGWVDYLVSNATSRRDEAPAGIFDRAGKRETISPDASARGGWDGWALVMRKGTLKFPIDVELWSADGSVQTTRWDGEGDWIRLPYHGATELARVVVDPAVNVTVDADLFNNAFRSAPPRGSRHVLERATYSAELGLQFLMP